MKCPNIVFIFHRHKNEVDPPLTKMRQGAGRDFKAMPTAQREKHKKQKNKQEGEIKHEDAENMEQRKWEKDWRKMW